MTIKEIQQQIDLDYLESVKNEKHKMKPVSISGSKTFIFDNETFTYREDLAENISAESSLPENKINKDRVNILYNKAKIRDRVLDSESSIERLEMTSSLFELRKKIFGH